MRSLGASGGGAILLLRRNRGHGRLAGRNHDLECHFDASASRRGGVIAELGDVQLGVPTAAGQQLFVGAALDDAAALDDQDHIGGSNSGQSVGDDDRRASGERF